MNKKLVLFFMITALSVISQSHTCCPSNDDYDSSDYDHCSKLRAYSQPLNIQQSKMDTLSQQKKNTPQSLVALSCASLVKNDLETIEHQLNLYSLSDDKNLLKHLFSAALSLPSEDPQRFSKVVTILKKMPIDIYGDLAFIINRNRKITNNYFDKKQNDEENTVLYGLLQYLPNPFHDIHIKTIQFFRADYRNYARPLTLMVRDALDSQVPHQALEILLNNGAVYPHDEDLVKLIPHPRYCKITNKDSENILAKLKIVLGLNTSQKQKIKEKAQEYLSFWDDPVWSSGKFDCLTCPTWHRLGEPITVQELEEMEENKQFFIDAIALIEGYEKLEAQEKEDQILPF